MCVCVDTHNPLWHVMLNIIHSQTSVWLDLTVVCCVVPVDIHVQRGANER